MSKKILIVGSGGMLGKDIADSFIKDGHDVYGISRDVEGNKMNDHVLLGDITDKVFLNKTLKEVDPEIIINCAAIVNVDACENNKELAYNLHVNATQNLASYKKAKFIYISTDSVFDGQKGDYKESDQTNPLNYYAQTKLEGENAALLANPNTVILRTNIYGFHLPLGKSLAEWAITSLSNGDHIKGFTDTFFNPLYTKQLAEVVKFFSLSDFAGTVNAVSDEVISKYDFLLKLAKNFGFQTDLISKSEISKSESLTALRPKNTYLNNDKITKLYPNNNDNLSLEKGLKWLCEDFKKNIGAGNEY